ncbi:hypothetical protein Tco_0619993 [Tanacetum coccineum]
MRRLSWTEFILAPGLHTGEEIESLIFARYWSESERMITEKGDLRDYWRDISTDGDFLGPPPSYTLIRDPVLRLFHRMMAHSIADVGSVNIPYLLARYLRRFAAGRKSEALILGGQFVARLAKYFGLLTVERLQGLMAWVPARPARQEGDAEGVAEEVSVAPRGGDEDEEMPQAVPPPPRTQGERIAQLKEEVHGMRKVLQGQREVLYSMAQLTSTRFTSGLSYIASQTIAWTEAGVLLTIYSESR